MAGAPGTTDAAGTPFSSQLRPASLLHADWTDYTALNLTSLSEAVSELYTMLSSSANSTNTTHDPLNYTDIVEYFSLGEEDFLPRDLSRSFKCLLIIAFSVIIFLSVVGNVLVLVVIASNAKMRTATNTFLASLAVSDLLIGGLNMPLQLLFYVENEWRAGAVMCVLSRYMQGVVVVATILTLTGLAIDRYYAICNPLRARHIHTLRRAALLIAAFWLASFLLLLPQAFIQRLEPVFRRPPAFERVMVCVEYFSEAWHNTAYTLTHYFILYLTPVVIMFCTYGKIAYTLWIRGPIGETPENPRDLERRLREKKRVVRMLMVIVVLFSVSWFPYFTRHVYMLFEGDAHAGPDSVRVTIAFLQLLAYSNCCINPIIYCFLNDNFQQHFFRTLGCSYVWRCVVRRRRRRGRGGGHHQFDRLQPGLSVSLTRQSTLYQNSTTV